MRLSERPLRHAGGCGGIPFLVIECENANKDEAIAFGGQQISRYHRETLELFVSQQLFTPTDAIGLSVFGKGVTP